MNNQGFGQHNSGQGNPQGGWPGQGGNGQPGGPQWGQPPQPGPGGPPQQGRPQQFPQQPWQGQPQQPWQQNPGQPPQQWQNQQYPQQQWQPHQQGGFQPHPQGQPEKQTGAKVAIWIIVAVAVIGLGVGAWFLIFAGDDDSDDTAAEQQTTAPAATQSAEPTVEATEPAPETEGGDVQASEPAETTAPEPTAAPEETSNGDQDHWMPPNATEDYGILRSATGGISPDVPNVVVYLDFQCPACAVRAEQYGPAFDELVEQGRISMEFRFATFLDNNSQDDSSTRAAQAAAVADELGKFQEMYDVLLQNQPPAYDGYTDEQLLELFPVEAGITGDDLDTYKHMMNTDAFSEFVWMSNEVFYDSDAQHVPYYEVGGSEMEFFGEGGAVVIEPNPEAVMAAIEALS